MHRDFTSKRERGSMMAVSSYITFLILGLGFMIVGVGVDAVARFFYLYGSYIWLDLVTHFTASFGLGITVMWLFFFSSPVTKPPRSAVTLFGTSVAVVLVIGLAWEWFEAQQGLIQANNYVLDTSLDVLMDALGAVFAGWCAWWWQKRSIPNVYNSTTP